MHKQTKNFKKRNREKKKIIKKNKNIFSYNQNYLFNIFNIS